MTNYLSTFFNKKSSSSAAAQLTLANLVKSSVGIVSGILIAKWLLPEQLGEFNALSIFTSYIILAQVGIPSGLSRDLPFLFGKKDNVEAEKLASTARFFLFRLSLLVMIISVIFSAYFLRENNINYALGSIVVGATSFQNLYVTKYLKVLYRTNSHFTKLALITLLNTGVTAASIIIVYYYSFYGLCLRAILIAIVDSYTTNKWKPLKVKAQWSQERFKALIKTGLPMYSVSNIYGLWPTVQRTLILTQLGTTALGLYALANIVQNFLNTYSGAVSSVAFPKMSSAYGSGMSILNLLKIPLKLVLLVLGINLLILLIGWNLLPTLVESFLPNYSQGVEAAQWMLFVSLIGSLLIFSNVYMVIKKNQMRLISYLLGIMTWFLYIQFSSISEVTDIVVFSQALFVGYCTIALSDFIIITSLVRRDERSR